MEPTREEIDQLSGPVLLEFGASWCGHCLAAAPSIAAHLKRHPDVRHIKIEDGRGKPLGRSFRVKLWPTLVFMKDGEVQLQVSRPEDREIAEGFAAIS